MISCYKCIIFFLSLVVYKCGAFTWEVPSSFSHFTKRVLPDLLTGGKVTERQIQYLAESGFKSIISTLPQDEELETFNGISGPFPSSTQEIEIAKQFGMNAIVLDTDLSVEWTLKVSDAILEMEKPIYLHCGVGYGATLFAELHAFRAGTTTADDLFSNSLYLGWDYQANEDAVSLVNEFTKLDPPAKVVEPSIESTLTNGEDGYKNYYWSHRVGNDLWYNIGQVLESQVSTIADAGYKTVISFRENGEPTSRTSTDPAEGPVNNGEFSDRDGNYSAKAEMVAFESAGVNFLYLPVAGEDAWTAKQLNDFAPLMDEAAARGPVLAHCRSGYRSAAYVSAYLALRQKKCTHWALQQARRVGYSFDVREEDEFVVDFFQSSLQC